MPNWIFSCLLKIFISYVKKIFLQTYVFETNWDSNCQSGRGHTHKSSIESPIDFSASVLSDSPISLQLIILFFNYITVSFLYVSIYLHCILTFIKMISFWHYSISVWNASVAAFRVDIFATARLFMCLRLWIHRLKVKRR